MEFITNTAQSWMALPFVCSLELSYFVIDYSMTLLALNKINISLIKENEEKKKIYIEMG